MLSPVPPTNLFCAAAAYACGISSLRNLARHYDVPVARLRHELAGIRPRNRNTFYAWLDAVPGRRVAWAATAEEMERENEKFVAEFTAQNFELEEKLIRESLEKDTGLEALLRD